MCIHSCNAELVTTPPVTCTKTNTCLVSDSCMASTASSLCGGAMNLICDAQLVHNTTVQTVKLYTSCSQPVVHTHCTTSHYTLHSHTALHHTTAYTLTMLILFLSVSSSLYSSQSHDPNLHQFSQHIFIAPLLICTPPHLNVV